MTNTHTAPGTIIHERKEKKALIFFAEFLFKKRVKDIIAINPDSRIVKKTVNTNPSSVNH
jgi:hypothetical protein